MSLSAINATAAARPLAQVLPAVTPAVAAAAALVHDRRFTQWARGVSGARQLDVAPTDAGPGQACLSLHVGTSQGAATLVLPRSASVVGALIADLAQRPHLQEQACTLATAWLQSLWSRGPAPVDALCVRAVRALPATPPGGAGVPCLMVDGCAIQVVELDPSLARALTQRMAASTPACAAPAWLMPRGRLRVGLQALPAAVLRTLCVGDVLLAPRGPAACTLHFGNSGSHHTQARPLAAPAHLLEGPYRVALTGPLTLLDPEPPPMTDDTAQPPDVLSELPLQVSFEIDTAQWTLAQMAAIGPGQIVPLDAPLDEALVRLVCQGRVIGHGQLIALGERLGVRISRLA